jgi:hemolysin activation/secretion protein
MSAWRSPRGAARPWAAFVLATLPSAVAAQVLPSPGTVQQEQGRTLQYYELQKRLREAPPAEGELIEDGTAKPPPAEVPREEVRLFVRRIETPPSQVLPRAELTAITATVEDREVGLAELFEVLDRINALYRAKGCVTCRAFLPPQKVQDGTVEIRLVEGKLGAVTVEGATYIREDFILERIRSAPGEVLRVRDLERDLAFINNTNDFKTAARLKPGASYGTVDAVIVAQEPQRLNLTVFGDNAGRDDIGRNRVGLVMNARSLFGRSDPLTVTATGADGTMAGTVGYSIPVTTRGTRIGAQYDYSAIDIRSGPFAPLDITGTASNAGLSLSQPLFVDTNTRLNLVLGYNTRDTITKLAGTPVTRADTRNVTLGFDVQRFDRGGVWYARPYVTIGMERFGGDLGFVKLNADGVWSRSYDSGLSTVVRGSFQLSDTSRLPAFEQFFVGGMATVRGYREGVLIGDRGYFVSAEAQFPLWPVPASGTGADKLRAVVFFDQGAAFPERGNGEGWNWSDFLVSTGGGITLNLSRYLSGRAILGLPLAERGPNPPDWVFHVYVQSIVF